MPCPRLTQPPLIEHSPRAHATPHRLSATHRPDAHPTHVRLSHLPPPLFFVPLSKPLFLSPSPSLPSIFSSSSATTSLPPCHLPSHVYQQFAARIQQRSPSLILLSHNNTLPDVMLMEAQPEETSMHVTTSPTTQSAHTTDSTEEKALSSTKNVSTGATSVSSVASRPQRNLPGTKDEVMLVLCDVRPRRLVR